MLLCINALLLGFSVCMCVWGPLVCAYPLVCVALSQHVHPWSCRDINGFSICFKVGPFKGACTQPPPAAPVKTTVSQPTGSAPPAVTQPPPTQTVQPPPPPSQQYVPFVDVMKYVDSMYVCMYAHVYFLT